MAKATINTRAAVKFDPKKTAELLCSEDFLAETYKKREEVVDAVYTLKESDGGRLVFEIEETHYKRSKTGSLDKSDTTTHTAEYRFDPDKSTLSYDFGAAAKFRIKGAYGISASGSGSTLSMDGSVDVPIPIVGRLIVKLIKKEIEKGFTHIVSGLNGRA
jgi:hypothetical protein